MKILGIETSCDETGVAVYDPHGGIIAEGLYSQLDLHARFGGVVPELASRDHVAKLTPMIREVLADAEMELAELDGIAYTAGPGLVGALMVGGSLATGLAMGLGKPVIPVHHMEAHLLAALLEDDPPAFPFVALLVSGGHSLLVEARGLGDYAILGETLDDAAGEAFDKVARLLSLPYPGGPPLAALAEHGDPEAFPVSPAHAPQGPGLQFQRAQDRRAAGAGGLRGERRRVVRSGCAPTWRRRSKRPRWRRWWKNAFGPAAKPASIAW